MNGGSIEDLVNDLTKVDGQIKTVKSKVDVLGGKVKEIDTIFTELNEAVSQINEVGNMVVIEPATPEGTKKEEEGGIFSNFFNSSAETKESSDDETKVSSDVETDDSSVMSPLKDSDLNVENESSDTSVPSELNNGMIVDESLDTVPSELNNGMIVDESDAVMKEALTEDLEESKEKAIGGRSRKNRKQKNAKSKKLRGGKRTKRRNQKKGGAKKSKRRA
jgi:hypothetical protein